MSDEGDYFYDKHHDQIKQIELISRLKQVVRHLSNILELFNIIAVLLVDLQKQFVERNLVEIVEILVLIDVVQFPSKVHFGKVDQ